MWYYAENDTQKGPISQADLEKRIADNQLSPGGLVWTEGMSDWKPWAEVPELSALKNLQAIQPPSSISQPQVKVFERSQTSYQAGLSWIQRNVVWVAAAVLCLVVGCGGWAYMGYYQTEQAKQHYAAAIEAIGHEEYSTALAELERALSYKENPLYYYQQYIVYRNQGNYPQARLRLDKALAKDPQNSHYHHEMSDLARGSEYNTAEALESIRKAIAIAPSNLEYYTDLGIILGDLGRTAESKKAFEEQLKREPTYPDGWANLATLYSRAKREDQAEATMRETVKLFPEDAYQWFRYGSLLKANHHHRDAIAALQKSIQLEPESGALAAAYIAEITGKPLPEKYRAGMEIQIPARFEGKKILVQAEISGKEGTFVLDTKSMDSALYEHFLTRNHLPWERSGPVMTYHTPSGFMTAPLVNVSTKLGGVGLSDVDFAVMEPPAGHGTDGIIGSNALRQFDFQVDTQQGKIFLSRKYPL